MPEHFSSSLYSWSPLSKRIATGTTTRDDLKENTWAKFGYNGYWFGVTVYSKRASVSSCGSLCSYVLRRKHYRNRTTYSTTALRVSEIHHILCINKTSISCRWSPLYYRTYLPGYVKLKHIDYCYILCRPRSHVFVAMTMRNSQENVFYARSM